MSGRIEARLFNGTRDLMPEEMIPRQAMLAVMTRAFERYGFAPVETPAIEFLDILLGKYGEEGDRLVYPLAYKGGNVLGLRYDLTVPLSRLVAMRPDLPLPFKRYQIQPVWRGDRPQPAQGRYREFYQCDVDTIGAESLVADAENVAVAWEILRDLGLREAGLEMRINDRRVLRAIVSAAGLPAELDGPVCTALDKIDKIGREKVEEALAEIGVDARARAELFAIIALSSEPAGSDPTALLGALEDRLKHATRGEGGVAAMRELFDRLDAVGVPADVLRFDLVLTRGLDYYTGPIYEFRITALENFGSLGGGGRYDDLLGAYGGRSIPATGVSIGLSRVQGALTRLGRLTEASTPSRALVLRLPDVDERDRLRLITRLRRADLPCELFYDDARFKKQIAFADRKGIPFVVIQGPKELERDVVQVKDLASGEQSEMSVEAAVARMAAPAAPA